MAYEYGVSISAMKFNGQPLFTDAGSWEIQKPEDDSTLWRYMSFAKFCSLLEQKALFFSLVGDMVDRYEGFIYPLMAGERGDQILHMVHGLLRVNARNSLVSCWTESSHESNLMWETYVGVEGVAVRTTFRRLQDSLRSTADLPVSFGRVEYVDYGWKEISRLSLAPQFHKRMEFGGESEVRAVLPGPHFGESLERLGPGELPDVPLDPDVEEQRGRYIPVNLGILLEEIVLPPHAAPWFGRIVESAIKRSSLSVRVKRSSIESMPDY